MNPAKEILDHLFEPLGLKARTFVADYRDNKNVSRYIEYTLMTAGDANDIASNIRSEIERKGGIADCVYEILSGYTLYELEEIIRLNPEASRNYTKLLYFNRDFETA